MSLENVFLSMKGLSIEDLLVVQEVQRKDYGRSPGLSRASLQWETQTCIFIHTEVRGTELCNLSCMPLLPSI